MNELTKGQQVANILDKQGTIAQKLHAPAVMAMIESKLRGGVTIADFQTSAIQAATDPKLAKCNPATLFMAMIKVAELGLLPGSTAKHVALIPRGDSIDVMPMFRGYLYLMRKIPGIANVEVQLVHDTDAIEYDHAERRMVQHDYPSDPFARGFTAPTKNGLNGTGLRGGYCRFTFEDGTVRDLLCPGEHIIKAMGAAQTKNVWTQWFELMALKTVANYASARLATFLDVDQGPLAYIEALRDHDNTFIDEPEAPKAMTDQRSGQDVLRDKLNANRERVPVAVTELEPAVDDWGDTLDAVVGRREDYSGESNVELLRRVMATSGFDVDTVLYDLTKDCGIEGCTTERSFTALTGEAADNARAWLLGKLEDM